MPIFSEKSEAIALQLGRAKAFSRDKGREVGSAPAARPLINAGILEKASRRPRGASQTTIYWLTPLGAQFAAALHGPRCRHCRCTEMNACEGGCSWISKNPYVCSSPACVRKEARGKVRSSGARRATRDPARGIVS